MVRKARSPFAILGMLTLRAMTGYELRQMIDRTIGYFWQESFGQLYPALAHLEQAGLVSSKSQPEGERARHVYAITRKGRAAFKTWLSEAPLPYVERNELLLKLFFGSQVDASITLKHVTDSRADAAARLSVVREILSAQEQQLGTQPGHEYYWATLRYGELGLEAHIRWCDEVSARLENSGD